MMSGDAADGLASYDLTQPVEIFALSGAVGINNHVRGVRTGAGDFAWKTYLSHRDPATIRYEHRLLAWLAGQSLPFATPLPVPTRSGDTLSPTPDGTRWQALFAWLPGAHLDRDDPALIKAFGAALGELHGALARYPSERRPGFDDYAALNHLHPNIPDSFALTPAHLGAPPTDANTALLAWWRETLNTLRVFIDGPYRTLPRQVIHGDVTPGNAFADGGEITALFDFEFATSDVRAIDVASGLVFTMRIWERDAPTALLMARRFRDGYARRSKLTTAEIAALPELMLLRDVVGAIWWLGRDLAAGDTRGSVERIVEVQRRARWLARHAAAFRDAVR
ncbi:MAG: phosphotransferase [Thermomicrobiales bacterium]